MTFNFLAIIIEFIFGLKILVAVLPEAVVLANFKNTVFVAKLVLGFVLMLLAFYKFSLIG